MNSYTPIIALVISAISLGVSWMNFFRDKPNAKVVVFKDALVAGAGKTGPYMSITITNIGRRPLTISTVGYRELWKPSNSIIITAPSPLPQRLNEGENVTCVYKRSSTLEGGSWKNIAYVFASDTTGKEYRFNITSRPTVLLFNIYGRLTNPLHRVSRYMRHRKQP